MTTPSINPTQCCLNWYLTFTTMATVNKLDEEQQLGAIAAHKSKFTSVVEGPNAVKEIMKAQLFAEDAECRPTPTRLKEHTKKFSQM